MLHETMHAYIHSYLYTSNRTLKTTTLDKDFNEYSWLVQGGSQDVEHNFMAQNWVTTLTQELMKLHQTQDNYERVWTELIARGLNGNNRVTFYESLAWKGLEGTNAYKSLTPEKKDSLDKYYREKNVLPISKKWKCEE